MIPCFLLKVRTGDFEFDALMVEEKMENQVDYNPYLLITGLFAGVGGLLISSLVAWLWTTCIK